MSRTIRIGTAWTLATLVLVTLMLAMTSPQAAFATRYWGDTDTVDQATGVSHDSAIDGAKDSADVPSTNKVT